MIVMNRVVSGSNTSFGVVLVAEKRKGLFSSCAFLIPFSFMA